MTVLGIIGIIICIALLMFLTYRGLSVIIAAPVCAFILILFTQLPIVTTFSETFAGGAASYIETLLPVTLAGAVLGAVYSQTGAAYSLAKNLMKLLKGKKRQATPLMAIFILYVVGMILAYGGIHVVALAIILLPLSLELMREANMPKELAPGLVLGCVFTSAMTLPGSPQTPNVIPMSYLGTSSTAALVPGLVGAAVVLALNIIYLNFASRRIVAKGAAEGTIQINSADMAESKYESVPNPVIAAIPLALIFVLFNVFDLYVVYSIFAGIIVAIILFWKQIKNIKFLTKILGEGAEDSCYILVAGAVMGGFGAVIAIAPSFEVITNALANFPGPALIAAALAVMIIVGVSGSAPAGLGTALPLFLETFQSMGINMSALHRVASFAATTFDSLPTNATFLLLTKMTGLTVRQTYKHVFITTVVNTAIGTLIVALMCTWFPGLV